MQQERVFANAIAAWFVAAIAASCATPSGDSGMELGSMSIEDTSAAVRGDARDSGMDLSSRPPGDVGSDPQPEVAPVSTSPMLPAHGPETVCDFSACRSKEPTILWKHEIVGYVSFIRPTKSGSVVVAGSLANDHVLDLAVGGETETSIPFDSECAVDRIAAADVSLDGGMVALLAYCPTVVRFGQDRNVLWEFEFPFFSDVISQIGTVSLPNVSLRRRPALRG